MLQVTSLPIKQIATVTIVVSLALIAAASSRIWAATLNNPTDYLSSDTLSQPGVSHTVNFQIPAGGHTIVPTDYIRINLPNFSSVTAPTNGDGWVGAPIFGVSGNIAYITNVSASPGDWILVGGITATNPASSGQFGVIADVASDLAGTTVYDSASFNATILKGVTTVSVSIPFPTATITLAGFTSPGALVTITLNGTVAGTTIADSNGDFSKTITGILPGNYAIGISAADSDGRQTGVQEFNQLLIAGTGYFFSNISMPPTLSVNPISASASSQITFSGLATPNAQLTLIIDSPSVFQQVVTVPADGRWQYILNTTVHPLGVGSHQAFAQQIVTGGYLSNNSPVVTFNITTGCGAIAADINCDGSVDLADFSIMMYYWRNVYPGNPRADINGDTVVNLTDFSILLYYWTD